MYMHIRTSSNDGEVLLSNYGPETDARADLHGEGVHGREEVGWEVEVAPVVASLARLREGFRSLRRSRRAAERVGVQLTMRWAHDGVFLEGEESESDGALRRLAGVREPRAAVREAGAAEVGSGEHARRWRFESLPPGFMVDGCNERLQRPSRVRGGGPRRGRGGGRGGRGIYNARCQHMCFCKGTRHQPTIARKGGGSSRVNVDLARNKRRRRGAYFALGRGRRNPESERLAEFALASTDMRVDQVRLELEFVRTVVGREGTLGARRR